MSSSSDSDSSACNRSNKGKKQKPQKAEKAQKASTLSPEEIAQRKAASQQRCAAIKEKIERKSKMSNEERRLLAQKEAAERLAAAEQRWEASHHARMQYCHYAGLVCVVSSPSRLDPIIGTAACQQYGIIAVILHNKLRKAMSVSEWTRCEKTCNDFLCTAAFDVRANLLPVVNYKLPELPRDLLSFYSRSEAILSPSELRYLQLALALWENSVTSYDEFGQLCRIRGNASLGKFEAEIRSEFSQLADKIYAEQTKNGSDDNKLLELYQKTVCRYFMDKQNQYPILCPSVFTTFNINQHLSWHLDIIVAVGITRVGIQQKISAVQGGSSQDRLAYRLGFCDVLYFKKGSSRFELIEEPTEEERSLACLFYDCVGTSFMEKDNAGMFSLDKKKFREFFKNVDLAWLLVTWAAGHPDHAGRAESKVSLNDTIASIYGKETRELQHNQFGLESFDLSRPSTAQANPGEIVKYGLRQATANGQTGESYFNDISVKKDEAVPRTANEMYFHVFHVYASTGKAEEQRQQLIEQRHAASSNPAMGRYIFTSGKSGHSCTTKDQATSLQTLDNRLQAYLSEYPQHKIFSEAPKPKSGKTPSNRGCGMAEVATEDWQKSGSTIACTA